MSFFTKAGQTGLLDELSAKRAQRLIQISAVTFIGLLLAAILAEGSTQAILGAGLLGFLLSAGMAAKGRIQLSASILLLDLFLLLSCLVWVSGGIRYLAMLGYPGLLIFAFVLGGAQVFAATLLAITLYSTLLAVLTVQGQFVIVLPDITYAHIVFVNIIFWVTGFGVFVLIRDMQRLMASLKKENQLSREREQTISELARRDQLTSLYNRRDAEKRFALLVQEARQKGNQLAVFFLDLDNFKPVNDSLGHAAGDLLLQQLSCRLQESLASDELLYRFGGDEFLLVHIGVPKADEQLQQILGERARQLLATVSIPMQIMEHSIVTTASIGVAIAPLHADGFTEISRLADMAMYEAKKRGRNSFCIYHQELGRASIDKFRLLKQMQHALDHELFELWYQPKICLASGKVVAAEALLRWPQADGSLIAPDAFIPLAEQSGMIGRMGRWVADQAIRDCAHWQAQGFRGIGVSVNVSPVQFRSGDLPGLINEQLQAAGLDAELLELELTESLLIDDSADTRAQLDQLTVLGLGLAIDDFGTGYSNISYLNRFPARRLKIDKTFIMPLAEAEADDSLVKAMLQIAASFGFQVVAEGVETEQCLQRLQALGCAEGQGYFWSPALPMEKWLEYLREHQSVVEAQVELGDQR